MLSTTRYTRRSKKVIVTAVCWKEQLSRPEFTSNNANTAGNPLPFEACVLIPNSCGSQTSVLLQRTLSRDGSKRRTLLTVLKTWSAPFWFQPGEEGSATRRNLAGKKRGKQVLVLSGFSPRHFPQDPSTRRERKSWRNYHTLGRRHSSRSEQNSKLSQLRLLCLLGSRQQLRPHWWRMSPQHHGDFNTPSTAPHFIPLLHSLFFFLRKAHRSVLSAPLARSGFEMHFNLSTQTAFIAFRVPLRPGFKSSDSFFL